MLQERHRCRVAPNTPYTHRRVPHRSRIVPLEDVGIVPGNRLILLPLKKVTTVVRRHRWCRSSAISTKSSIVRKSTMMSQRALLQTAPPTPRVVCSNGNNCLNDILRPSSVRSSNRLARRASLKQRHAHAATLKTCRLPPVLEQEQGDINSFAKEFLSDQGNWSQENKQTLHRLEKFKGSLHNWNDRDLSDFSQSNCKRIESEWILGNQVSELADIQSTSMSRSLHDSGFWSEDGVHKQREDSLGQEKNGFGLDAHNIVSNTRSYDVSIGAPDLCANSLAGGKRLSQQSGHTSSGSILVLVPACLGEHLEHIKEKDVHRKGLELGAVQRVLRSRIRQFPGDSRQDSYLPVLDQFVTKKQSVNDRADELQKESAEAQFSAERDSAIRTNQEEIGRAVALEEETVLRGEQQTKVTHLQRRANKKLRKVFLKIHTFGRNRVSPSSSQGGHNPTSQVKSISQQFLLLPQMQESSLHGVGELDKRKVRRSERFRNQNEDFRGDRSSAVTSAAVQTRKYLKGFLCALVSNDELPIEPIHMFEEQLLN